MLLNPEGRFFVLDSCFSKLLKTQKRHWGSALLVLFSYDPPPLLSQGFKKKKLWSLVGLEGPGGVEGVQDIYAKEKNRTQRQCLWCV